MFSQKRASILAPPLIKYCPDATRILHRPLEECNGVNFTHFPGASVVHVNGRGSSGRQGSEGQAPPPMLLNFGRRTMGIGMGSGREHHRTHTTPHISRSTTMIAPLVMVPPVRIRGSDGEDPGNLCRQMTLPAARCGERHCIRAPLDLHTLYF